MTDSCFLFSLFVFFPFPCADLFSERLVMAKDLGADFQLLVKRGDGPKQLAKTVEDMLGTQPHVTIECTGAESCVQTAIYVSVLLDVSKHARSRLHKQQTLLYLHLIAVLRNLLLSEMVRLFSPVTLNILSITATFILCPVAEITELLIPAIRRLVLEVWWWWWASALRWSTFLWWTLPWEKWTSEGFSATATRKKNKKHPPISQLAVLSAYF